MAEKKKAPPAISSKVRGKADKVRLQLEALFGSAKNARAERHDKLIDRCRHDFASKHHPKYAKFEPNRSNRFVPLAETYGKIYKSAHVESHAPRPLFFSMQATNPKGEAFESEMDMEMLHVVEVGKFRRAIEEAYDRFLVNGYAPVLAMYDEELEVERLEVLDPATCWADPSPLPGVANERIWRMVERMTTVPDLLREQDESSGRKYDPAALKALAEKKGKRGGEQEEPEEFPIWYWWGDFYLRPSKHEPSEIMERHHAIWVEEHLLRFAPTETPGRKTPLSIWTHGANEYGDLYGRPILAPGVPIQNLANAVLNQGVDYVSRQIKDTPWIRKGSELQQRGITFGRPIVSESKNDFEIAAVRGNGTGMDALFGLLPQLEQEYARAIGAQLTHQIQNQQQTATAERIQAGASDTRTKSAVWGVGEQIASSLSMLQLMRAKRKAQAILAGVDVSAERRQPNEDPETARESEFGVVSAEAWKHKYKVRMIGAGMVADRAARLAGYEAGLGTLKMALEMDPSLEGRPKLAHLVQSSFEDNLGRDMGKMLRDDQELEQLAQTMAAKMPPQQEGQPSGA